MPCQLQAVCHESTARMSLSLTTTYCFSSLPCTRGLLSSSSGLGRSSAAKRDTAAHSSSSSYLKVSAGIWRVEDAVANRQGGLDDIALVVCLAAAHSDNLPMQQDWV